MKSVGYTVVFLSSFRKCRVEEFIIVDVKSIHKFLENFNWYFLDLVAFGIYSSDQQVYLTEIKMNTVSPAHKWLIFVWIFNYFTMSFLCEFVYIEKMMFFAKNQLSVLNLLSLSEWDPYWYLFLYHNMFIFM